MSRAHQRPRRDHIVSGRFNDAQYITLAAYAHRQGKTLSAALADFVLPTEQPRATPRLRIALKARLREAVDESGQQLNSLAHDLNRSGTIEFETLLRVVRTLSRLLEPLITSLTPGPGVALRLTTPSFLALNRVAVNLRQIATRLEQLDLPVPEEVHALWAGLTRLLDRCDEGDAP